MVEAVALEVEQQHVVVVVAQRLLDAADQVAKNHRLRNGTTTPTTWVRPETRQVAAGEAT